jgi:hypothetical protein
VALHEIDYDAISVKQMTAKRSTPEEGATHTHLPPPLPCYSTKESKSAEGTCGWQHRDAQGEDSSRNTQHLIGHSPLLIAAPISIIGRNHHSKNSKSSGKIRIRTPIKSQVSKCRLLMKRMARSLPSVWCSRL